MRFAINLFIVNYLAKDQRNCNEELHFVRLTVILVKTVKKANKLPSDGSGWYLCGIFAKKPINRTVTDQAGTFAHRDRTRQSSRSMVPGCIG